MRSRRALIPAAAALIAAGLLIWPSGPVEPPPGTSPSTGPPSVAAPPSGALAEGSEARPNDPAPDAAPGDPATRVDDDALEAEYAARPLSAWIALWRKQDSEPSGAGSFTINEVLPPEPLPAVEGLVLRDRDGSPVAGAVVAWCSRSDRGDPSAIQAGEASRTRTDARGRFSLERMPSDDRGGPLSCLLRVEADDFATVRVFPGAGRELVVRLPESASLEVTYPDRTGGSEPRLLALDQDPGRSAVWDPDGSGPDTLVGPAEVYPDDGSGEPAEPEVEQVRWEHLMPGDYRLFSAGGSQDLHLTAGERRQLRLDPAEQERLVVTVLGPGRRALPHLLLRLVALTGPGAREPAVPARVEEAVTDADGRIGMLASGRAYRVAAELDRGNAPWVTWPAGEGSVGLVAHLGTVAAAGEQELSAPPLAPFALALHGLDLAQERPHVRLVCREPGHGCVARACLSDGRAQGVVHEGRYAVFADGTYLGDVALPGSDGLPVVRQQVHVRWRAPGLGLEQALRGRAWLRPAFLMELSALARRSQPGIRGRLGDLPCDMEDPLGGEDPPDAFTFWADAEGRLSEDPVAARHAGGWLSFVGAGRYVLAGWSDRGPFQVEVELPAPGGIDVVLDGR